VTGNTRMSAKLAPARENAVFFGFARELDLSSLEQVQQ
jgi:hypothetical protein